MAGCEPQLSLPIVYFSTNRRAETEVCEGRTERNKRTEKENHFLFFSGRGQHFLTGSGVAFHRNVAAVVFGC